jgi:hypothetical protein
MKATEHAGHPGTPIKRWSGLVAAASVLWGCAQAPTLIPAQPAPKPTVSYVNIPISIPLAAIEKSAEAEVPRSYGVAPFQKALHGGAAAPACGEDVGYSIERGPVSLSGSDKGVVTSVDLSYWLKARKQLPCPGTVINASCGTDGEPPGTASVGIDSEITILPNLETIVRSTPRSATAGSRCVLQPEGLDITNALMVAFDNTLRQMLPALDKRVSAALDLRTRMQAAWTRMSEPREIQPGIWLAWNPEGLGVVPVSVADGALQTGIQLRVRPVISAGTKPVASPKPLPLAYSATRDDTFKLQLPVDVQQAFVQARLDSALDIDKGGMPITMGSYKVRITGADITGEGSQILIKLRFSGDLSGAADLTATPYFDPETRTLSFPDLDYTLDSDQFLLKSANFVAHSQIRDKLREKFTIELGQRLDKLKGGLDEILNRRNGNVQLHGTVEDLTLLGVSRQPNGAVFTAYIAARGKLSAEIEEK